MSLLICTGLVNSSWEQLPQQFNSAGLLDITSNNEVAHLVEQISLAASSKQIAKLLTDIGTFCTKNDYFITLPFGVITSELAAGVSSSHESDIKWLLFYGRPTHYLANISNNPITAKAFEVHFSQWQQQARLLGEVYRQVSPMATLFNIGECITSPQAFIDYIGTLIDSKLDAQSVNILEKSLPEQLVTYLGETAFAGSEQLELLEELYDDLKLQTDFITSLSEFNQLEQVALSGLFIELQSAVSNLMLKAKRLNKSLLHKGVELSQLDEVNVTNKHELERLVLVMANVETENTVLHTKISELNQSHLSEVELLTLQLTQLQDELASINAINFDANAQLQQLTNSLNTSQSELENELEHNAKLSSDYDNLVIKHEQALVELDSLNVKLQEAAVINKQKQEAIANSEGIEEQLNEVSNLNAELMAESKVALLQINQLQEELEDTFQNNQELAQMVESLTSDLQQALQAKANVDAENEITLLQINQLQTELEEVFSERQELAQKLASQDGNLKQLLQEQVSSHAENEKALLNINQQQAKLENTSKNNQDLTQTVDSLKSDLQQALQAKANVDAENEITLLQINQQQTELENTSKKNQELTQMVDSLKSDLQQALQVKGNADAEKEITLLQINQLQAELEETFQKQQALTQTVESLGSDLQQALQLKANTDAENEIALLQINQLQEELEIYFQKFIEQEKSMDKLTPNKMAKIEQAFSYVSINSIDLLGQYDTDGYHELKLQLNNLALADGRLFESLRCKLVNNSGCLGIEFRPTDELADYIQWHDKYSDEYGSYVVYYPQPSGPLKAEQDYLFERLNSSDRILINSIANNLAHYLAADDALVNLAELSSASLRHWRVNAYQLASQASKAKDWMSFDAINLKEEMRTEGYEHLWLTFDNLLIGERHFEQFDIKASVTEITDEAVFANQFSLEFRELANGLAPLQAWPPEASDDFGDKLILTINTVSDTLEIQGIEHLTPADQSLVGHLINNFSAFIGKLHQQQVVFDRSWQQWEGIGNRLYSLKHQPVQVVESFEQDVFYKVDEIKSLEQNEPPLQSADK
ncbi:hypothetical protein [Shewanella youngdeokensis]|uniref:Chromosome segregation ATPase-like protein n=1 Tax=Shewanella youngdeokensis TaxID=2999068 RepID=A0ABZ0K167_9GAMM|nr:hypothetical protein RGE70_05695 [Shewanella sp. DAU334]